MFTLPETRFDFGGDEYIYAEISRDMSEESNFKALAITSELRRRQIPGILDICPSNSSYLIRFDPEVIPAANLLDYLKEIDMTKSNPAALNLEVRIVEIPIWYDDPITREYSRRFQERNIIKENISNFELVMKLNGFKEKEAFIEAHSRSPYLISMMGFIPGTAWEYPLGLRKDQIIQTPKYASPRTDTPGRAVGLGGAFTVIYPLSAPGSYQLIGMAAVPVFDQSGKLEDLRDSFFLARPGDIWKHHPVEEREYKQILSQVEAGTYRYRMKYVDFSPEEYFAKREAYIKQVMEDF
ncbi:carboxyltransferase domain-containing protein [Brevibacillus borstelensis]|uniref:5-oxoprolinase subunit B family protein n=1 Tax=Brevibacillus TaxID=55080 RepID=UPI00203B7CC8|nr:carboxyltransferase domain-containing protein [Brevibacillus borstelensis]MCM3622396.1 carboxyltransferase domain-containing protein [Brevibacillus borstelensis]MED2008543.1 carboxyltransferase domain-containing protein [Brevibacillus borstelensis]